MNNLQNLDMNKIKISLYKVTYINGLYEPEYQFLITQKEIVGKKYFYKAKCIVKLKNYH